MTKILVVDDEKSIRRTLRDILELEKYTVDEAVDGLDCLVKIKQSTYDVVILDIKMPKQDGMETLERIQTLAGDTPVIMISGHGDINTAVEAVKKGAFDFIQKPPDLNRLLITIRNAMDKSHLISEKKVLQKRIKRKSVQEIIGKSDGITFINQTIDRVAPTEARILVTGENGTGKELVARWVHEKSNRQKKAIVEVNCAAIPAELIESELFGHEKGSFTSAHKQRIGKFELANGGTLFLDEIGDMSLSAQAKVLRALQENRITRVGGEKEIEVNVRIVAATNKDLRKEILAGRFREDLYHRLAVILIHVPALKDRRTDIPLLVEHFNQVICKEYGVKPKIFESSALKEMQKYGWTGNIRELRNVVERLIILCQNSISKKDIQLYLPKVAVNTELEKIFEKYNDEKELVTFLSKEYNNYKSIYA